MMAMHMNAAIPYVTSSVRLIFSFTRKPMPMISARTLRIVSTGRVTCTSVYPAPKTTPEGERSRLNLESHNFAASVVKMRNNGMLRWERTWFRNLPGSNPSPPSATMIGGWFAWNRSPNPGLWMRNEIAESMVVNMNKMNRKLTMSE